MRYLLLTIAVIALFSSESLAQTVVSKTGDCNILWNKNNESDLAGYRLYVNGQNPVNVSVSDNPGTTCRNAGIRTTGTYDVAPTAYDWTGNESALTQSPVVRIQFTAAPVVITYVKTANDASGVKWGLVDHDPVTPNDYFVYRNDEAIGGNGSDLKLGSDGIMYVGGTQGDPLWWTWSTDTGWVSHVSVPTTPTTPPVTPILLGPPFPFTYANGVVTWTAVQGAVGYVLHIHAANEDYDICSSYTFCNEANPTTSVSQSINVKPSTTYDGWVQAKSTTGHLGEAQGILFTTPAPPVTPKPTISVSPTSLTLTGVSGTNIVLTNTVTVSNSGQGVLAWHTSPAESFYTITAGNLNSFVVNINLQNLQPGTYTGKVQVIDSEATNSPLDVPINLTVTAPPVPTGPKAPTQLGLLNVSNTKSKLTWTAGSCKTKFNVYYFVNNSGTWNLLGSTTSNELEVTLTTSRRGFRVAGVCSDNTEWWTPSGFWATSGPAESKK